MRFDPILVKFGVRERAGPWYTYRLEPYLFHGPGLEPAGYSMINVTSAVQYDSNAAGMDR